MDSFPPSVQFKNIIVRCRLSQCLNELSSSPLDGKINFCGVKYYSYDISMQGGTSLKERVLIDLNTCARPINAIYTRRSNLKNNERNLNVYRCCKPNTIYVIIKKTTLRKKG